MNWFNFALWVMGLLMLATIAAQLKSIAGQLVEMNRCLKNLSLRADRGHSER